MNQRQKKKRMTKALKILSQAEVIEFDCEGEDVLYIDIEDTPENVKLVTKACSILGLDKKKFIAVCREDRQDEGTLDLSSGWFTLIRVEPKKFTIWYSLVKGFHLVRCLEEEEVTYEI